MIRPTHRSLVIATAITALAGCKTAADDYYDAALESQMDQAAALRARECEQTNDEIASLKAAEPFEVVTEKPGDSTKAGQHGGGDEATCSVVGKGLKAGTALKVHGLKLPHATGLDCDVLKDAWTKSLATFNKSLTLRNKLACGPDGKPIARTSSAVELDARTGAYSTAASMLAGRQDVDPRSCYPRWQKRLLADRLVFAKLRCDVLTTESDLAGMTSAMLVTRANLAWDDVDPGGTGLAPFRRAIDDARSTPEKEAAEARLEAEKLRLVAVSKLKYCTPSKEPSLTEQAEASLGAGVICGGHDAPKSLASASTSGTADFDHQMKEAVQKLVAARGAKREAEQKACTEKCKAASEVCSKGKRKTCASDETQCNAACK